VFCHRAHPDYQDAIRFFAGTHPTENLKLLIKEVTERLEGVEGGTPIFRLETGFGGGKSHALIATVHAAREGERLLERLSDYGINRFPRHDTA
jgi:predicted AAA+ superfamily ATPase